MLLPAAMSSRHWTNVMHGDPLSLTPGICAAIAAGCVECAASAPSTMRLTQSKALAAYGLGSAGVTFSWARNVGSWLYAIGDSPVMRPASDALSVSADAVRRRIASLTM